MEEFEGEVQAITPRRIATRRLQAECRAMTALIQESAAKSRPAVALMDGTLILWSLETEPDSIKEEALGEFEEMLGVARANGVPVAGYISRPGSSEVLNSLRALACGLEKAECRLKCAAGRAARAESPCSPLQRITDLLLFNHTLRDGQRSALFGSQSKILRKLAPENRILFFYLDSGKETARIEIPAWVSENQSLLDLVHMVVYDQAQKGLGYPRALTEAHELAVVRGPERAAFFQFVQREMALRHVPAVTTRKAVSKRSRSV